MVRDYYLLFKSLFVLLFLLDCFPLAIDSFLLTLFSHYSGGEVTFTFLLDSSFTGVWEEGTLFQLLGLFILKFLLVSLFILDLLPVVV